MEKNFLQSFEKRMKCVGRYAVLIHNSIQKTTWKQFGIEQMDERINLIFSVLLYIMEYSLKEEDCTIDDIAGYVAELNDVYYKKELGYEEYRALTDFIVNKILSNDGVPMYFQGFNYELKEYENIHISYLKNKVVYQENGIRRVSYSLTEDGYNIVLSTMELESHLKLTVHEMLFKLHLEKADYERAVNDIKNVFEQLRIQHQKIQDAMHRIRRNALSYTVEEYRQIVEENIATIERTRGECRIQKEVVEAKVKEFEEQKIDNIHFDKKEKANLDNLKIISGYLNQALDEHQKILNQHFDLKYLYEKELENYAGMTMIQRFHFGTEIYERVMQDISLLEHFTEMFNPLMMHCPDKIYHPAKALEYQRRLRQSQLDDEGEELGFDEAEFLEERRQRIAERLKKYYQSLEIIIVELSKRKKLSLQELQELLSDEELQILIPTAEIFREIMIELLTAGSIRIADIEKEKNEYLLEAPENFQLYDMLLQVVEKNSLHDIDTIYIEPSEEQNKVIFENVMDENGRARRLKCANINMWCK